MQPKHLRVPLLTTQLIDDMILLLDFELSASLVELEARGLPAARKVEEILLMVKGKEFHMELLVACKAMLAAFQRAEMLVPLNQERYDFWEDLIFRDSSYLEAGVEHAREAGAPEKVIEMMQETVRRMRAAMSRLKEVWVDAEKIERDALGARLSEYIKTKQDKAGKDESFAGFPMNQAGLKN